jgi:soluble lytic murein transglycosylase
MNKVILILIWLILTIPSCSREINWKVYWSEYSKYSQSIQKWSNHYGLDTNIVKALISWESGWTPKARGMPHSCRGLMQVNGGSFDPDKNIKSGCSILKRNLILFGYDYYKALIGYNAGSGKAKGIIKSGKKWNYSVQILRIAYTLSKLDHRLISLYQNKRGLI